MQQIPKNPFKRSFWMVWAKRLLHLYPADWQERYADEMLTLLEDHPPTFWTFVDLLLSLCDAYPHPDLVSARIIVPVKEFYRSIAAILSVGLFFYLLCKYMFVDNRGGGLMSLEIFVPLRAVPPLIPFMAFVLRQLNAALSISLALFGASLLLLMSWQAFKTRRPFSFSLSVFGVLCPVIVFLLSWNNSAVWIFYYYSLIRFFEHVADLLSLHNDDFLYPLLGACIYVSVLLVSRLLVRMGGGLWRATPRQAVPGRRLANVLLALATLCAVLLFLFCSGMIFLVIYQCLSGFGETLTLLFKVWWLLVLPPMMILLTATSLVRAYQSRHLFTIQTS